MAPPSDLRPLEPRRASASTLHRTVVTETGPITYRGRGRRHRRARTPLSAAKDAVRATFTPGVLSGHGALRRPLRPRDRVGATGHVLVASADGVGTKLEVAKRMGVHDTVGRDLVQHCINDILVQGARPLFFMDYVGTGRLEPDVVADLIRGCANACEDAGMALLGGETAEMPGLYGGWRFRSRRFIVGAVARDKVLDGSRVAAGQTLIGLDPAAFTPTVTRSRGRSSSNDWAWEWTTAPRLSAAPPSARLSWPRTSAISRCSGPSSRRIASAPWRTSRAAGSSTTSRGPQAAMRSSTPRRGRCRRSSG